MNTNFKNTIMWIAHLNESFDVKFDPKITNNFGAKVKRVESFNGRRYIWFDNGIFCIRWIEMIKIQYGKNRGKWYCKYHSDYGRLIF